MYCKSISSDAVVKQQTNGATCSNIAQAALYFFQNCACSELHQFQEKQRGKGKWNKHSWKHFMFETEICELTSFENLWWCYNILETVRELNSEKRVVFGYLFFLQLRPRPTKDSNLDPSEHEGTSLSCIKWMTPKMQISGLPKQGRAKAKKFSLHLALYHSGADPGHSESNNRSLTNNLALHTEHILPVLWSRKRINRKISMRSYQT